MRRSWRGTIADRVIIVGMRIGHGFDAHRFGDRRRLMLGGIEVTHPAGLAGHSDADVVLHAIIDAMLGAAGLGDIGGMFPSSDERWRDAESIGLLRSACDAVRGAGFALVNVDATVVAQEPRLAPFTDKMCEAIAAGLGIERARVNVKATTTDEMGFTGRGEGIAAFAVVLIE
jgi:2-C-methyl-D-erythritol 2,4-cyclodiphosphate synthase